MRSLSYKNTCSLASLFLRNPSEKLTSELKAVWCAEIMLNLRVLNLAYCVYYIHNQELIFTNRAGLTDASASAAIVLYELLS